MNRPFTKQSAADQLENLLSLCRGLSIGLAFFFFA
jgi:hypothetical protein